MANSLQLQILLILISFFIFAASTAQPPSLRPPSPPRDHLHYSSILSTLGFLELSSATSAANLNETTPITIFAPSDSSISTCPSCSLPLLLREHSVPGLFPLPFLRSLAFATKLETLAPNRCLTITSSATSSSAVTSAAASAPTTSSVNSAPTTDSTISVSYATTSATSPATSAVDNGTITSSATTTSTSSGSDGDEEEEEKIFVNGVEITSPDMFNNGLLIIHGIQGFVTHLSRNSCNVERMTSLAFPPSSMTSSAEDSSMTRLMLKDVIVRLRSSGYIFVALALRLKFDMLVEMKSMTIFALDDAGIFAGEGLVYLSHFRFHVVPERHISGSELVSLPVSTELETAEPGERLVVTTAGGGGRSAQMKINYVRIKTIDLLVNSRIVVHAVSIPFPHILRGGGSGIVDQEPHCEQSFDGFACDAKHEDRHGL